jgi:CubicO group peptidase (beta-lactamase class C family)
VRHLLTHTSGIDGDVFTDTGRGDDCVERYVGLLAATPGDLLTFARLHLDGVGLFDQLADGTPYLYMSGRVTPRVG